MTEIFISLIRKAVEKAAAVFLLILAGLALIVGFPAIFLSVPLGLVGSWALLRKND